MPSNLFACFYILDSFSDCPLCVVIPFLLLHMELISIQVFSWSRLNLWVFMIFHLCSLSPELYFYPKSLAHTFTRHQRVWLGCGWNLLDPSSFGLISYSQGTAMAVSGECFLDKELWVGQLQCLIYAVIIEQNENQSPVRGRPQRRQGFLDI